MSRREQLSSLGRPVDLDKRAEIITVAVRLFAEHGLAEVSLRDISHASGYSLGSLYNFFPEKAQLYSAAVERAALHCAEILRAALHAPGEIEERFGGFCRAIVIGVAQGEPHFRLLDRAGNDGNEYEAIAHIAAPFAQVHDDFHAVLEQYVAKGANEWSASYVIAMMVGLGRLNRQHWRLHQIEGQDVDAFIEGAIAFALRGLHTA